MPLGPLPVGWAIEDPYHEAVHTWYYGTIDTSSSANDGSTVIPTDWYTANSSWPRTQTGFYWSRLGGGASARPAAGLGQAFGGSASRVAVTTTGTQWPNIGFVILVESSVYQGTDIHATYQYQNGSTYPTVYLYLDTDRNPYNNQTLTPVATISGLSPTYGQVSSPVNWTIHTYNVSPGTYYLCAKITDASGLTRYDYSPTTVTISNVPTAQLGNDLTINGQTWSDASGYNTGVIEGGDDNVSLQVSLYNNGSTTLANVQAALSSSVSTMNIRTPTAVYPQIAPGTSQWGGYMYMELNQSSYANCPFTLHVTYQKNGLPYYHDFTLTQTFYAPGSLMPEFQESVGSINDSSGGNGDGILQSGESANFILNVQNTGNAPAQNVFAQINNPSVGQIGGNTLGYGNLPAGGSAQAPTSGSFLISRVPQNFTGPISADVVISYYVNDGYTYVTNYVSDLLTVQPATWISVTSPQDFGVHGSGSNITVPCTIYNVGSQTLNVTNIISSAACTTWTGSPLPWAIPTNNSVTIQMIINPTNLVGEITEQLTFLSDARPGGNVFTVSGLISDGVPIYQIPSVSNVSQVDVSSNVIVALPYSDCVITCYNITNGNQETLVAGTNLGVPMISGNIVAWETGYYPTNEIFAMNINSGQTFAVATPANVQSLIGVDGNYVAFQRVDYSFSAPHDGNSWDGVQNIYVYNISTGVTTPVTQYAPNGNNPVQSAYGYDFGGGIIAIEGSTWTWISGSSGNYWTESRGPQTLLKYQVGLDSNPIQIYGKPVNIATANNGQIAYIQTVQQNNQVMLWNGSSSSLITTNMINPQPIALGTGIIAYTKANGSASGLYYWDLSKGVEGVVSINNNIQSPRMDGNVLTWIQTDTNDIHAYYAIFNQADISILPQDISTDNNQPVEGQPFDITATLHNLATVAQTNDITVRLYDGNPDLGGIQLGTDQIIAGGIAGNGQAQVQFTSVSVAHDGTHQLYVRLFVPAPDNFINNTASITLPVQSSNPNGPTVSGVSAQAYNGDGDGLIGSDEQVEISFILSDPNGISSATLLVDGNVVTVTNNGGTNYTAIFGPLSVGVHQYEIQATDGDTIPATSTNDYSFTVVSPGTITVSYNGTTVSNSPGSVVNVGNIELGPNEARSFVVQNVGQRQLFINMLSATGNIIQSGLATTNVSAGQFTSFGIIPTLPGVGSFTGTVSLVSSDTADSPFTFGVTGTVVDTTPPQVTVLTPANGSFIGGNVTLNVSAYDYAGVAKVLIYRDSGVLLGTFTNSPYSMSFNTTNLTNGAHVFYARAYDVNTNSAFSQTNAVTVDNIAPTVTISTPTANQRWSNVVFTVTGTASDNARLASVWCQLNGGIWNLTSSTNGYSNWTNQVGLQPGTNVVQAFAVDAAGNNSATNSVRFDFVVTNQLQVRTIGLGTISPNYSNSWLEIGRNYSMSATAGNGFMFTNWTISTNWIGGLITNNATVQFMMASNLTLQASFTDTNRPVLSITNLTAGQRWSNLVFTARGTATDNWQVASVQIQLNGGTWTNATGTTNWSAPLTLTPGTNKFAAFATDTTGNNSMTNSLSFQYVVTNLLTVQATGLGTISPNYSNAWLNIGQNYSMTATPASGFVVTNWTISTNWLGGRITNNATVQFMMASNLTLQVNFADVTKPTLTITAPTAGQHMTNALATVVGTTSDNWKVAGVWYQLNSNAWNLVTTTTNNYTNWTQMVTLLSGTNTLKAYAVDLGGNFSTTNTLSVVSSNTFKLQLAFTNALPMQTNGLVFILQLSTGLDGHIQVSTNLTSWVTLTNFVGTNSTITFRDPAATNSPSRFYRAVIP